jgi:glycosyltransferase involved in cell wall biosynthesis
MGVSGSFLSKLKYNNSQLDSIICVSRSVQNSFGKILSPKNREKIVVVNDCVSLDVLNYNAAIDIRKLYNIPESKFIIGNIANHTNAKDLYTLIDVLYELKNRVNREDIVFIQIGEYSKITDQLKQYATDKKVLRNIVFMGEVKNASSLNTQFDAFLLTSQREGGPTSLLEAMLLQVPVVSTKVGIVSDILIDGENGFVTDVKDSKSLAKKIQLLLDNKDLQVQFKQKGNKIIKESLTAKSIAQKTFGEYQRVLSN